MELLTVVEEMLLLTIFKLGDNAYGVPIRDMVIDMTGKRVVYGTLYNSLNQLVRKGFVITQRGEPTAERGGRSKVFYLMTDYGMEALRNTRDRRSAIWADVPDLA
ncbi:helix-turn-helix transcriptional regulator [bacterium]|nr:helix-turn-helix transcriptional regulator [bacterium]